MNKKGKVHERKEFHGLQRKLDNQDYKVHAFMWGT